MRGGQHNVCGCFPTGRHYSGIADRIAAAVSTVVGLAREVDPTTEWVNAKLAVIDFETTGLDSERDRVLEMGIVLLERGEVTGSHNFLVDPGIPVPEEARKVHGITDEELATAPKFEEILSSIVGLLSGRLPVAYNARFDKQFLGAEFGRLGAPLDVEPPPALRVEVEWIDPLVWVRELQKDEKGHKLTEVCARMGIPLDQAHRAAGDAQATGKLLLALAPHMPRTYSELIRIQRQYDAHQEAEMVTWRARRPN